MEGKTLPQMAGVQIQENTHEIEINMVTSWLSQPWFSAVCTTYCPSELIVREWDEFCCFKISQVQVPYSLSPAHKGHHPFEFGINGLDYMFPCMKQLPSFTLFSWILLLSQRVNIISIAGRWWDNIFQMDASAVFIACGCCCWWWHRRHAPLWFLFGPNVALLFRHLHSLIISLRDILSSFTNDSIPLQAEWQSIGF